MKKYIVPSLKELQMTSQGHILAGSLKVSDETVTGGWVKAGNDWDIFGEYAEEDEE